MLVGTLSSVVGLGRRALSEVTLTTADGAPVTDVPVLVSARSLTGALGTTTVTGTVPDGVTWLAISANPDQQVFIDGEVIAVTLRAEFEFSISFGILDEYVPRSMWQSKSQVSPACTWT